MSSTNETPRSVELGLMLRQFRKRASISQQELAAQLGRQHSHVSRWENGKLALSEPDIGAVLGVLRVTGTERDSTLALHRDAADPNWLTLGVGRQLALVREYESNADRITNVQPSLVPGPLQTRDYAMGVLIAAGATQGQAQDWTDFRMARRDKILGGDVKYHAIIGEYALRYPACQESIALDQMRQLRENAGLEHITIQILPIALRYTPARAGSFVLIESDRSKPIVHLEHLGASTTLTDVRYVQAYQNAADTLRRDAMSLDATAELVAQLIEEMERTI